MDWDKSKILTQWFSNLAISYNEFRKASQNHRCKIVNIETDPKTNKVTLFVMLNGIKKTVIPYCPQDLVIDDAMLNEFSSFDVRAITFYALQVANKLKETIPIYCIDGQEFLNGKTIFIIKSSVEEGEERRTAHALYCDSELLTKFSYTDLKTIISTAIQEQAIEDFQNIEE